MGDFKDFFFHQKGDFADEGVRGLMLSSMIFPKLLAGGRMVDFLPNENFSLI